MKTVDTRGYSCPEPVIQTQNAVNAGEKELEILVDTDVSRENVIRYLDGQGFKTSYEEKDDHIVIHGNK